MRKRIEQFAAYSLILLLVAISVPSLLAQNTAPDRAPESIEQLIEQLGHKHFYMRQRAEKKLSRIGFGAYDQLKEATDDKNSEIAARAQYLLGGIEIPWTRPTDSQEVHKLLADYGDLSMQQRESRVAQLHTLSDDQGLAALCRIVRYESSPAVSKRAALVVLKMEPDTPQHWSKRSPTILQGLGSSRHRGADWLRTKILSLSDQEAAQLEWVKWIQAERNALNPNATDNEFVLALMQIRVELLKELKQHDAAVAQMVEMIEASDSASEPILKLIDWLAKDKSWDTIDKITKRLDDSIQKDPLLLYVVADVKKQQGQPEQAERLASKAFGFHSTDPRMHLSTAIRIHLRGMFDWAVREYEWILQEEPISSRVSIYARLQYTELLHDYLHDKKAGELLKELLDAAEKDKLLARSILSLGRSESDIRARMNFMFALDHGRNKRWKHQREALDQAVLLDPTDADVLITMYRSEGASPEYKEKTQKLIGKAVDQFRTAIQSNPKSAVGYNQLAWLVSNTEGDYEEAVRMSHKSLEIRPNTGGYLDTLGRCYYAKGDYENAVKYQRKAVQLEPHSQAIVRQLALFEAALKQSGSSATP